MNRQAKRTFVLLMFVLTVSTAAAQPKALDSRAYAQAMPHMGIVMLNVNWGRQWGCAGTENAQLQHLAFSRLPLDESSPTLDLKTPSKLFVEDRFIPYAYAMDPGIYAITAFDVKVARSSRKVGHIVATKDHLFEAGNAKGGTFEVVANEVVYIGHFGLDCAQETIPWRYYMEGRPSFDSLVSEFKARFPFADSLPIRYRLFATTMFGQPFSLADEPENAAKAASE